MHFRPKPFDCYPSIPQDRRTFARELIRRVGAWHGVSADQIVGPRGTAAQVVARFDAVAAVYQNCTLGGRRLTLSELGRLFGGRNHSTIWDALRARGLK